ERCQETAAVVAEAKGLKVETLEDMGEVHYGDWTGRTLKELAREPLWKVVQTTPSAARFPEGESLFETQARAVLAVERLREAHPRQTVAVCSHADVIKALACHYLGMHLDLFQRVVVSPASVTAIAFGPAPYLVRLNDVGGNADLVPPRGARRRGRGGAERPVPSRDLDPVTGLTADAVGEPGQRTFYLQAASGADQVTLLVEKEQVRRVGEEPENRPPRVVPGQRPFHRQPASGADQVPLLVEKEQVRRLAENLETWLPELAAGRPEDPVEGAAAEAGELGPAEPPGAGFRG